MFVGEETKRATAVFDDEAQLVEEVPARKQRLAKDQFW